MSTTFQVDSPITDLPGVGDVLAKKFQKLNIETVTDLLHHFPVRYVDTAEILDIQQFLAVREGTLLLTINSVKVFRTPRKRMVIVEATGTDGQSFISLKWFNQPYIARAVKEGERYLISGKLTIKYSEYFISSPDYELVKSESVDDLVHLGRITPIYPETAGISSKRIRSLLTILKGHIDQLIKEPYSTTNLQQYSLVSLNKAIKMIHFPDSDEEIKLAQDRLAFDEIYKIQKALYIQRKKQRKLCSKSFVPHKALAKLVENFPYKLTDGQQTAIEEIMTDISKNNPMHRMLIGDVGSGKTIVALAGLVTVMEHGYSALLMAPTTVLAHQHYKTVNQYLPDYKDKIKLITGEYKDDIADTMDQGGYLYIGTHALMHTKEKFKKIGMVVVDEQHRFGVKQRGKVAYLKDIDDKVPHYLIMSATPIPRTLAISLYGNLDLSIISELPPGRIPIKTKYISSKNKSIIYNWIKEKINRGRKSKGIEQLMVICPLIEESELLDAESVEKVYGKLRNNEFKGYKIVALHGKMKDSEKKQILDDFAKGKYDILVGTSVIEVGIDIPNATMMIIENAERFGLAQLHQLRGRIGRRNKQAYCFVFASGRSEDVKDRLMYFSKHNDGLKVAEYDLKRRGPGEVYGLKQAGIPELHFANLMDKQLIEKARDFIASEL